MSADLPRPLASLVGSLIGTSHCMDPDSLRSRCHVPDLGLRLWDWPSMGRHLKGSKERQVQVAE